MTRPADTGGNITLCKALYTLCKALFEMSRARIMKLISLAPFMNGEGRDSFTPFGRQRC